MSTISNIDYSYRVGVFGRLGAGDTAEKIIYMVKRLLSNDGVSTASVTIIVGTSPTEYIAQVAKQVAKSTGWDIELYVPGWTPTAVFLEECDGFVFTEDDLSKLYPALRDVVVSPDCPKSYVLWAE